MHLDCEGDEVRSVHSLDIPLKRRRSSPKRWSICIRSLKEFEVVHTRTLALEVDEQVNRVLRTLSAFNRSTNRWTPIPSSLRTTQGLQPQRACPAQRNDVQKQVLSVVSWNINAFHSRPIARAKLILNHILEGPECPDVIFLQEVTPGVCDSFLDDARVRSAFLVTDAEDDASFDDVPFATMTLLSNECFASSSVSDSLEGSTTTKGREKLMLEGVFRIPLPSKYGRDALCVDIATSGTPDAILRLLNVHLDSLDSFPCPNASPAAAVGSLRATSMPSVLRTTSWWTSTSLSTRGSPCMGRQALMEPLRVSALDLGINGSRDLTRLSLLAGEMEVVKPGVIEVPRPAATSLYIPWSDHCGLRCTLTV
ncbi:LOW QUALITY PROTEIN: hypothetical protein CVT26_001444 [Gymnopilus dilepis]|uniref:Endonuclease/exonuclease/phosphatase domain-containing protein n=1 Tax=Gymnopilus dilepis TaxID=231916 RepID=A0A409WEE8_9AGAR|nr:LOW QUALITY PROTEIN: hypothetical protein CVT26_001444 [Gymnopilus dilepis]